VLQELELLHPLRAVDRDEEDPALHALGAGVGGDGGPDDRVPVRPHGVVGEPLRFGQAPERGAQHVTEARRAVNGRPAWRHLKKILDSTICGGV